MNGLSLKQGMGNRGIGGIRESGNPGIGKSGNPGIGELSNRIKFNLKSITTIAAWFNTRLKEYSRSLSATTFLF